MPAGRGLALLALTLVLAATLAAFALPLPFAALILAAATALLRHRLAFLGAATAGALVNGALFALLLPGVGLSLGPVTLSQDGLETGLAGALRLAAGLAPNLALLSRWPAPSLLEALRLPARASAVAAAVLATVHGIGRDAADLMRVARLDGRWPHARWRQVGAAARLLPPLVVLALRHGHERAEALRLAGHATGPRFAALVAFAALAAAGRMAVVAIPNDPVTYAAVFLAGVLAGPRMGAAVGALAMAGTNLLLSGLLPAAFANVPAMALVGILGGSVGRLGTGREGHWATRIASAAAGVLAVLGFSILADTATWLLVPEYRGDLAALRVLLAAGLAFNALPAAAAAALFALAVAPVVRGVEAAGLRPDRPLGPGGRVSRHD